MCIRDRGRRIALFLVKFMGKRTLTLGYAIVIIDILLAPFTPVSYTHLDVYKRQSLTIVTPKLI